MRQWRRCFLSALFVAGVFGSATAWGQPAPAPAATPPPAVKVMTAVKPAGKININTADEAALTSLKGIGKTKAKAIIDYRQQNGPFKTVDDLTKVKGIGDKTLAALRAQLTTE